MIFKIVMVMLFIGFLFWIKVFIFFEKEDNILLGILNMSIYMSKKFMVFSEMFIVFIYIC